MAQWVQWGPMGSNVFSMLNACRGPPHQSPHESSVATSSVGSPRCHGAGGGGGGGGAEMASWPLTKKPSSIRRQQSLHHKPTTLNMRWKVLASMLGAQRAHACINAHARIYKFTLKTKRCSFKPNSKNLISYTTLRFPTATHATEVLFKLLVVDKMCALDASMASSLTHKHTHMAAPNKLTCANDKNSNRHWSKHAFKDIPQAQHTIKSRLDHRVLQFTMLITLLCFFVCVVCVCMCVCGVWGVYVGMWWIRKDEYLLSMSCNLCFLVRRQAPSTFHSFVTMWRVVWDERISPRQSR